ncbi:MFS transporter [Hydrogenophaga sp.]|uniref:MFS transporter n=1 Tax=Hydrogenophaga sp. TaxID=1904254 RepID=UPI002FC81F3B
MWTRSIAPSPRAFHGTTVVRAAFVLAMFGWGVGFYGPPIFLHAVVSRTGWTLGLVSGAVTVHFLWGAVVVAWLPRLHARWGIPATTLTGAVALALGVAGWAHASQPWQLFGAALLSGGGWVPLGAAGINAMVSPWFTRQRPAALSRAYNGASIGGMVFSPLWVTLMAHMGFAQAAWAVGVGMVAVVGWLVRHALAVTPAALGQWPDGKAHHTPGNPAPRPPDVSWPALPGRTLWTNRRFQTLAAAMALGLFAQIGLLTHLYSLLSPGLGTQGAGWAMALATACAIGGRTLSARCLPFTGDRRTVACTSWAVQMLGSLLLLISPGQGPLLWAGIVLFGAGIGNTTSLPPLVAQTDFAAPDVARVVALIVALSQALYALAPLVFALLLATDQGPSLFFGAAACLQLLALTLLRGGRQAAPAPCPPHP